jgi:uncharacterized protein YeaO (DUF488 family)
MITIKTKRIYEESIQGDGFRLLVDRSWPRGMRKDRAHVDIWYKDIAPSDTLRKWFGHDRARWNEFRRRYFKELQNKEEAIEAIMAKRSEKTVTLLYGAKDEEHNNAVVLKEFIEQRIENPYLKGEKMS